MPPILAKHCPPWTPPLAWKVALYDHRGFRWGLNRASSFRSGWLSPSRTARVYPTLSSHPRRFIECRVISWRLHKIQFMLDEMDLDKHPVFFDRNALRQSYVMYCMMNAMWGNVSSSNRSRNIRISSLSANFGSISSLERSVGAWHGRDKALWDTGAFSYAVYPDLPIATTWQGLYKATFKYFSFVVARSDVIPPVMCFSQDFTPQLIAEACWDGNQPA